VRFVESIARIVERWVSGCHLLLAWMDGRIGSCREKRSSCRLTLKQMPA